MTYAYVPCAMYVTNTFHCSHSVCIPIQKTRYSVEVFFVLPNEYIITYRPESNGVGCFCEQIITLAHMFK